MKTAVYSLEGGAFLSPGTLVVFSLHIGGCPVLHSEGHCLFNDVGTVVPLREEAEEDDHKSYYYIAL